MELLSCSGLCFVLSAVRHVRSSYRKSQLIEVELFYIFSECSCIHCLLAGVIALTCRVLRFECRDVCFRVTQESWYSNGKQMQIIYDRSRLSLLNPFFLKLSKIRALYTQCGIIMQRVVYVTNPICIFTLVSANSVKMAVRLRLSLARTSSLFVLIKQVSTYTASLRTFVEWKKTIICQIKYVINITACVWAWVRRCRCSFYLLRQVPCLVVVRTISIRCSCFWSTLHSLQISASFIWMRNCIML